MMQTDYSCFGNWYQQKVLPQSSLRQCSCVFYALTLIGPREARTGEPRENDFTAAFAKNAPMSVLEIACLLDFADFDKVVNPVLRSPAIKDFIAEPAEVCSKRAKAAPVSITLIPNCLVLLRGRALRLRTMTVQYTGLLNYSVNVFSLF